MASLDQTLSGTIDRGGRWRRSIASAARQTRPIWLLLAAYAAGALAIALVLHVSLTAYVVGYLALFPAIAGVGAALAVLALAIHIGVSERPARPAARLLAALKAAFAPERAARAILLLAAMLALQALFAFYKPLIPRFAPYSWDPVFAELDRLIFFGVDPWRLLWPLLGNPPAAFFINVAYHLWFFWMVLVFALVAFSTRKIRQNLRYFLAETMTWIVGGTLLAIVFSSVGPCYYGLVYLGPDPFKPLMDGLFALNREVPIFALAVQDMLWDGQMNPEPGKLAGISAMPSLHCATAVLRTLIAYAHDRRLGHASLVMSVLIFVGSVLLGWHYAVDGIVGGALALATWWAAGRVFRRAGRTA